MLFDIMSHKKLIRKAPILLNSKKNSQNLSVSLCQSLHHHLGWYASRGHFPLVPLFKYPTGSLRYQQE